MLAGIYRPGSAVLRHRPGPPPEARPGPGPRVPRSRLGCRLAPQAAVQPLPSSRARPSVRCS